MSKKTVRGLTLRRAFFLQSALIGFMTFPAHADFYFYQHSGGGDWNSFSDPYYSWYDQTTASTSVDFPPDNGVPVVSITAGSPGVSGVNVLFNETYTTGISGLTVGSNNTLTQSSNGTAMISSNETVGALTAGTYTQSAGSNTINGVLTVGTGGGTGIYNLNAAGSVSANDLLLGSVGGASSFNQSGGSVLISVNMFIGPSNGYSGLYSQTGGTLSVSASEIIGAPSATSTFTQSAGSNTAQHILVGSGSGIGTYNLNATGSINVSDVISIGSSGGTSAFNQSGGTVTTVFLDEAINVGQSGAYNLSGGTLTVTGDAYTNDSGAGTITQSGSSSATVSGILYVGRSSLAFGSANYNLQSGSLTAGTLELDTIPSGTPGVFNQTGGTLSYTTFNQAGGQYIGTLINKTTFNYSSGTFTGRLVDQGTANFNADFTASNGMELDSTLTIPSGRTITLNGAGLDNEGGLTLAGGVLTGNGALVSNGQISGYGTISGTGGFTNNLQLTQSGGNLILSNAGPNANNGNITLSANQFQLTGGVLVNNGTINLNASLITGAAGLNNSASGVVTGYGVISNSSPLTNSGLVAPSGGTLVVPAFTNNGTIAPKSTTDSLAGGTITNASNIEGVGQINNNITNSAMISPTGGRLTLNGAVTNAATGQIIAGAGNELDITQGLATDAGLISLTGGTVNTGSATVNNTGQITGYGTLRTGGLTNNGAMALTGGTSTVDGPVTNSVGKTINLKYQPAIFTGSVTNNGTIKTTNTTVTFTGPYSGNAYISDPSTNIFQNNVTVIPAGLMTGGVGDQYYMSGGIFTNNGTYTNTGFLQSSDPSTNSGTFTQGGTQNWSPGTSFTNIAGTATFQSDAGSASAFNLSVNVTGGKVVLANDQHWAGLNLSGSGTLDINNYRAFINYGSGPDPIASIAALIVSGYAGGTWTGTGIMSTAAQSNSGSYGIGYADSADPGNPAALASGQIEIMYTLLGDANLDGAVNGSDFAILATNFNKAVSGWDQGDFNYDGAANGSDFALLASNFNKGASQSADAAALDSFAAANGLMAEVPEPASAGILVMVGLGLLCRRSRRRCSLSGAIRN